MLSTALLSALLVPSLATSRPLPAPAPVPAVAGKVAAEKVEFKTDDKLVLSADYYAPKQSKKSSSRAPAAILVHDAGSDRSTMALVAERLHGKGLAVLAVDLRGHGDSRDKDNDWSKLDGKVRDRQWAYASRDLEAAAAWLKTRSEVHSANLTMVGFRAGCALSVYHAARDDKVRAVVLIEPANEQLGFDLSRECAELAGLETKVFTPKDKVDEAKIIQASATKANDGLEFIEVALCKSKGEELIHDRRVASDVAKWVSDRVFPKKGRR